MKLTQIERGVFSAKVAGKDAIVAFTFRDRSKPEYANNSVTIPAQHVRHAKAMASDKKLACYVGISVSVKGTFNQSWLVTAEQFAKLHTGESEFSLSATARKEMETAKVITGEKFEIVRPEPVAETKPAEAKATPAKKTAAKPAQPVRKAA